MTTVKQLALSLLALLPPAARAAPSLTTLHSFANGPDDGARPLGPLILVRGALYADTFFGGSAGLGTIFTINTTTGAETVLHSFAAGTADGANPSGGLLYRGGTFYGTARYAGAEHVNGAVFAYNATKGESLRYSFAGGSDGARSWAGLVYWSGFFYGTTRVDGGTGCAAHAG